MLRTRSWLHQAVLKVKSRLVLQGWVGIRRLLCLGQPREGNVSLKAALKEIGSRSSFHMSEVMAKSTTIWGIWTNGKTLCPARPADIESIFARIQVYTGLPLQQTLRDAHENVNKCQSAFLNSPLLGVTMFTQLRSPFAIKIFIPPMIILEMLGK